MKKTISINIGGVIFHIEEDGYEKLRDYLGSIQKYFSSFADSKEILTDIEVRIAERFLAKQKTENKQAISLEDVEELIGAMGTVADFEAIEQAEDLLTEPLPVVSTTGGSKQSSTETPRPVGATTNESTPRRLYRDLRRKLIGGVASGLAHYFTVDPLWVRLAFLVLVIGLPVGSGIFNAENFFGPISGIVVLLYIAMWIAFPGSASLEEDKDIKKFYRNPDRKVVGGVATGVASYFGVDIGVVRFLWVVSIFLFGTGLLLYIILWVIAPAANTLTEKMEMQGEPITLSNIESNIKRGLNLNENSGAEPALTKLLLFPFRAIAVIISGLGKILKGIGPILRIVVGALLVATTVISLLSILIGGGMGIGMRDMLPFGDIPPLMLLQEAPATMIFSIVLIVGVPLVVILLLGLTLIANRRVASGTLWLTLAGLWVVGIVGTAISGGIYQQKFSRRGEVQQTDVYSFNGIPVFDEYDNDESNDFDWNVRLVLEGYPGDSIKVEREITARGSTLEEARTNAMSMNYRVVQKDSVLRFDEEPVLSSGGRFRDQRIRMRVLVPYGRSFIMSPEFFFGRFSDRGAYNKYSEVFRDDDSKQWRQLRWAITEDAGLVCLNLPDKYKNDEVESDEEAYESENSDWGGMDMGERGEYEKKFSVSDFERVEIGGAYVIDLRQGATFSVAADGDRDQVEELNVRVRNGVLSVERPNAYQFFNKKQDRIGLVITMPKLRGVDLSGANKSRITGFRNLDELDIDLSGATNTEMDIEVDRLRMEISGASKVALKGRSRSAEISLSGASRLDGTKMMIEDADVEASGASRAELGKINNLRKDTNGASRVDTQQ
jgi:phage shock protein PspC (stress-responsive transcriptional regulator)